MTSVSAQQDVFSSLGLSSAKRQGGASNDASQMGMDTFLKLMVTQLNNQDPFKPMENGEFLGQIAQFGSVTGLDKLNQQMADLSASLTSGQALQAGSMVGREVLVPSNTSQYQAGSSVRGQVNLDEKASELTLRVYDQTNQLVREMPLNASETGAVEFSWDGQRDNGEYAAAGRYRVSVSARYGDQETELQPQLIDKVESVNLSASNGLTLNLAGIGPVAYNDVKQIF